MHFSLVLALATATAACTPKVTFISATAIGTASGGAIGHQVNDGGGGLVVGAVLGLLAGAIIGGALALSHDQTNCTDPDKKRC